MGQESNQARDQAIEIAADMMEELVSFWGFKASMGRIWTLLYLSPGALSADEIVERTGLSTGAVSMALTDLMRWQLVDRVPVSGERRRFYQAETDIWAIVRRIFRERELRLVQRSTRRFASALELVERARKVDPENPELTFVRDRLAGLVKLSHIGARLVESLAEFGAITLDPIRGALGMLVGRPPPPDPSP